LLAALTSYVLTLTNTAYMFFGLLLELVICVVFTIAERSICDIVGVFQWCKPVLIEINYLVVIVRIVSDFEDFEVPCVGTG
jgi:hypothetical protein